jgi:hypothetical protein
VLLIAYWGGEAERNVTDIFLRRFIAQGTGTLQAVSEGSPAYIFSHLT